MKEEGGARVGGGHVKRGVSLEGCNCLAFKMEDSHKPRNVGSPQELEKEGIWSCHTLFLSR